MKSRDGRRAIVRLASSVALSLAIVGVMAGYHNSKGALVRSWVSWRFYIDPWLDDRQYELRNYRSLQTDRFDVTEGLSFALSGRFTRANEAPPDWVRAAVEAGEEWRSRTYLGRPIAYAKYESTRGRWLGYVPSTTRLLFPGFIILVGLVYGGLWIAASTVRFPSRLRSLRRRRRGLCGRCGYDLDGVPSGICPECGAAVKG